MPARLSTAGFDRLSAKLKALGELDYAPLAEVWGSIIEVGNKEGVLAGLDGYAKPLVLGYRNKNAESRWARNPVNGKPYKMLGYVEGGDGPPLAPHWEASRVIANFETGWTWEGAGTVKQRWIVIGAWENVFTTKGGVQFLPFHFRGEGRLPRRDLAHIRPNELKAARAALRAFVEGKL